MITGLKNILVTGGAGFIGSHVVNELSAAGYTVRIMDNLAPPTHNGILPEWVSRQAEFVLGDVRNKEDWRAALTGMDAVIHLASYMDIHSDFSQYVRTNIESVALLFEVINEAKLPIRKIVAASSQSVYGEGKYVCPEHGAMYVSPRPLHQLESHDWEQKCAQCGQAMAPVAEREDDTLLPEVPYGISKLASEMLLKNLGKQFKIPVVLLRYSIVLGPHQSFRHFYSGALRAFSAYALNHEPIQHHEDGRQTRDFVHVKDVAAAHRIVLENTAADFESFNVGGGTPINIIDLAKIVSEEAGVPFRVSPLVQFRLGAPRHQHMDIAKLKKLGWSPQYSVRAAVKDYISWVRQFGDIKSYLDKTNEALYQQGILRDS